jgi:cytochrome c6
LIAVLFSAVLGAHVASADQAAGPVDLKKGGELFKKHCVTCHPDGGNIINPKKTLKKGSLESRNIREAADIVRVMRSPGQGMMKFDEKAIPDADALQIGAYILTKFK